MNQVLLFISSQYQHLHAIDLRLKIVAQNEMHLTGLNNIGKDNSCKRRDSYNSQLLRCFGLPKSNIGIITTRDNVTSIIAELNTEYPIDKKKNRHYITSNYKDIRFNVVRGKTSNIAAFKHITI